MTPIGTDQRRKEARESVPPDQHCWFPSGGIRDICEIGFALRLSVAVLERGLKETVLREGKALAGFAPDGHSGNLHALPRLRRTEDIQSVVSTPFAALTA